MLSSSFPSSFGPPAKLSARPSSTIHSSFKDSGEDLIKQLEAARQVVDERLEREQTFNQRAQLDSLLQGHSSSDYASCPSVDWAPLVKKRTIHLPDVLFDQYDIQEHRCLMGIFPEIDRAWFTVDNRLFLWDYADGSDFASFEQLEEIISAIAIARPKPGLFVSDIQHLLVIATPLTVMLVGLAFKSSQPQKAELSLYLTGLSVPTDGIVFTSIVCHNSTGRIFLVGSTDPSAGELASNGLFEFEYRSEEGWFKKKCSLVNHSRGGTGMGSLSSLLPSWLSTSTGESILLINIDQDRHLIYVLLKAGSIRMLSLGKTGRDAPKEIATVSNIVREALGMCPSAGPLLDPRTFEINGLHVISKQEGGKVGLVITTPLGVRMYFSHAKRGFGLGYNSIGMAISTSDQVTPDALWLCHVRLPPRNSPMRSRNSLSGLGVSAGFPTPHQSNGLAEIGEEGITEIPSSLNIGCADYSSPGGFWLAAHTIDSERNIVIATAPDLSQHLSAATFDVKAPSTTFSSQPQQQTQNVKSEVACPIPIEGHAWAITKTAFGVESGNVMTQMVDSQQEWLILSNMGITVLSSQRPVDTLAALLDSMPGKEQDLTFFWERFGRDYTCAMSVWIAVGQSLPRPISESPTQQTRRLGQFIPTNWGPDAAVQAKKLLHESSGKPEILNSATQQRYGASANVSGISDGTKVLFSGKHEGLALYMTWLLRPVWKEKVITLSGPDPGVCAPALSEKTLINTQIQLDGLRNFIDNETMLLTPMPDIRSVGRTDPLVYNLEKASIITLRVLLSQAVEALSFVLLLIDYKLSDVMAECPQDVRRTLLTLNYRDFITGNVGRSCARELVKTLINRQINHSFSVDAISETLQQRCGSFCTSDDVLLYKAVEALNRAKESTRPHDKHNAAREALQLFQTGVKHMSLDMLQSACGQFRRIGFLDGVVELSLACARTWDSSRLALAHWKDGRPKGDSRAGVYDLLNQCYVCIDNALVHADLSELTTNGLSIDEASSLRGHAIQVALASGDELFHYHFYDLLLEQNKTTLLLETQTHYLESYLKSPPLTLVKADLLWQHYTRHSAFLEAARILANLAEDEGLSLPLPKRIEYLSLAVSNAKSSPQTTSGDDEAYAFLTDMEEKLDVAQVQVEVLHSVVDLADDDLGGFLGRKEEMLEFLQGRLLTISELYQEVVEPLGLLESTLLVFHVSDHRDPEMTTSIWEDIIHKAHHRRSGALQGPEAVASKVSELGRKFYPSDVAFNLSIIIGMLAKYALDNPLPDGRRWVGPVLRESGVPWQAIWDSLDELFTSKLSPWHTDGALGFLAFQLAGVVEEWLAEVSEAQGLSKVGVVSFPAARLDDVIDRYVDALTAGPPRGALAQRYQSSSQNAALVAQYAKASQLLSMAKISIREIF